MSSESTKPSVAYPTWATGATGIAASSQPPTTQVQNGWAPGQQPPSAYFNYWQNQVGQWVAYLDGRSDMSLGGQAALSGSPLSVPSNGIITPGSGQSYITPGAGSTLNGIAPTNFDAGRYLHLTCTGSGVTIAHNAAVTGAYPILLRGGASFTLLPGESILFRLEGSNWQQVMFSQLATESSPRLGGALDVGNNRLLSTTGDVFLAPNTGSNVLPWTSGAFSLGSNTYKWNNGYFTGTLFSAGIYSQTWDCQTVGGTIGIGGSNATTINIGRTGATINFYGTLVNFTATNTQISDSYITVNNGGTDTSAQGAGLHVARTGTAGSMVYDSATTSRFKCGDLGSESEIGTLGSTQTYTGAKTFSGGLQLTNAATTNSNVATLRNELINGNFDFWQAGTSTTAANNAYLADMWRIADYVGNCSAWTCAQSNSSPPAGSYYFLRTTYSTTAAVAVAIAHVVEQRIEWQNAVRHAGRKMTLSFLVRSSTARTYSFGINVISFTSWDNSAFPANTNGVVGGSGSQYNYGTFSQAIPANTWTLVSYTFTMPSQSATSGLQIEYGYSISIGLSFNTTGADTNQTVDIAQVMYNYGGVAAPFSRAGQTIAEEQDLCFRYYERIDSSTGSSTRANFGVFVVTASTQADAAYNFKVRKRASPALLQGGGFRFLPGGSGTTLSLSESNIDTVHLAASGSGMTSNMCVFVQSVDSGGWIAFDARL